MDPISRVGVFLLIIIALTFFGIGMICRYIACRDDEKRRIIEESEDMELELYDQEEQIKESYDSGFKDGYNRAKYLYEQYYTEKLEKLIKGNGDSSTPTKKGGRFK